MREQLLMITNCDDEFHLFCMRLQIETLNVVKFHVITFLCKNE